MIDGFFAIAHNVDEAAWQEFCLAQKHLSEVRRTRGANDRDYGDRYFAARVRIRRARELAWPSM